MTTLLQINSSIFSTAGNSSQLANEFVALWQTNKPNTQIIVRDLANEPLPHLDAQGVAAFFAPEDSRSPEQKAYVATSDVLINEKNRLNTLS
ncbi:NAD(P)H-dependent oxidoreductase [Methylomonas sp. AM2-LC]|uniref:NAD(P)H-dependent oxidoreductase n=1 Tax=Methylomonas sp. AM2-LC TaxID=3153301 RepID=UPI003266A876